MLDPSGAFLPDRQDWLVLGVSQTRDSGALDLSNFETAQRILTDGREDPEDFEIHRFGHWGPGWFEIFLVEPGSRAAELAEEIESDLERYPVLDDEDFSRREWDDFCESWNGWACRDFVREVVKVFGLGERSEELLEDADPATLREFWTDHANFPYEGEHIPIQRVGDWIERNWIARLLRELRSAVKAG